MIGWTRNSRNALVKIVRAYSSINAFRRGMNGGISGSAYYTGAERQ
jgi:hypothetical protein